MRQSEWLGIQVGNPQGRTGSRPASPAQVSFAEAIAREKGIAVSDETRVCSAEMSKWIDANRQPKPAKGRKTPVSQNARAKSGRERQHGRERHGRRNR